MESAGLNRVQFFDIVRKVLGSGAVPIVSRAYWLSKTTHRGQWRDGGERYFEHCRRVAIILLSRDTVLAPEEIVMGLLHDCVEDGFLPPYVLEILFGSEVARGVSVLSDTVSIFDEHTGAVKEKIKKVKSAYFASIAADSMLVKRVKIADRLDNIRTMGVWPGERIKKYLLETEKYVLPIAQATDWFYFRELQSLCKAYRARH